MSLMQRVKSNNFSPSLSRGGKLEQKSPNTISNHHSFTMHSSKAIEAKRDHRKPQSRPQHSPLPSRELPLRMSRDEDGSYKQNAQKEVSHLNNLFPLPPIVRADNTIAYALGNIYLPTPLTKNTLTNTEKARMIRELNLKIQLLESKSKQPGLQLQDLAPLREEIYNKFDQYYITNRQAHSRFIDTDQQDPNQKATARSSRVRKASKELSAHLKVDSKTSSPRSSLSQQSSSPEKAKPHTSKEIPSCDYDQTVNRKTYKTMANISVVSLTNRSNNQEEEERPLFETQLSEKEMMDLDREPERKMSQYDEEEHHQSYIQLKENVRIMEERIGFLIHRLQENKREIGSLRQNKERIEKHCIEKQKERHQLYEQKKEISNNFTSLQTDHKRLKEKYEQKQRQNISLERQQLQFQKTISQLTNEVEYLNEKLKMKQNDYNSIQQLLIHKKTQCEELGHNIRSLEREFAKKRKELISQIQIKEQESEELKGQLRELKARMEIDGVNFKFEEASKLKRYIEENELLHQREIQKLDISYSSVINNFEDENRRIKNEKIQLQNVLVEWLGSNAKVQTNESHKDGQFASDLIKLSAVELKFGEISANQISSQLILLLQNYSELQSENKQHVAKIQKLEERINILKEEYSSIFQRKCDQVDNLSQKVEDLTGVNKILNRQKEDVQQQLREIKQFKLKNAIPRLPNFKVYLKVCEYRYPEPQLALIDNGTTFEKILSKITKVNLKRKLEIIVKLIDLALSFTGKKKLPTLNPACLTVQFTQSNHDFSIEVSKTAREDEDQNLHYCSPEVLLGFTETHQSHCWTIGIILDRLIHGKEYFNQYSEIISRKQNYFIRDEKYKSLEFLAEMLKKNQRQRIGLEDARQKIITFLTISHLQ